MCRKLLCLIALLGIVSVASAAPPGAIVIDDFESYWGTPAMVTPIGPWHENVFFDTTNVLSLVTAGGSAQGVQHGQWDWTNNGGWLLPDDPTNYDVPSDHVSMGINIANPFDIAANTLIHMSVQIPGGSGTPPGQMLLEWSGGPYDPCTGDPTWTQTWIPSAGCGAQWWIPPEAIPAKVWDDGWGYDPYVPGAFDYSGVPNIAVGGGWLDMVVDSAMWVTWGAPLVDFDTVTNINFEMWGHAPPDTSGGSGDSKIQGTTEVWPPGPVSGTLLIDDIWIIPEPMTIALLGLGGLALIRRKR